MIVNPILLTFVLATLTSQNQIIEAQGNNNSDPTRCFDSVIIQGNGGKSCPAEEFRDTAIAGIRDKIDFFFLNNTSGCVSVDMLELDGREWLFST